MSSPARKIDAAVKYRIERASPENAGDFARIHAESLPPGWPAEDFEASCADERRLLFKVSNETELLGLLVLQHAAGEAEILTLAVLPKARRQGIATLLLSAAIDACQDKLIAALYLEVGEHNSAAIRLYQNAGFQTIARRENYYRLARSAPETALIMKLDTKPALTQGHQPRSGL